MEKLKLLLAGLVGIASVSIVNAAEKTSLIINEVMQSNIDCILDDINEYPDSWLELYNPTAKAISLNQYKLGTSKKPDKAWRLPEKTIQPFSYYIVYCDKEDQWATHANFRVDSGKESLYLFENDETVDAIDLVAQPSPNISFGRETDGSEKWGYQLVPSPGETNSGGISDIILGEPIFSVPGRVGSDEVSLVLTIPQGMPEGTSIHYTLDGKEPTDDSMVYSEPITISSNTVVRAKLICEGAISPRSTTHSYIFHPRNLTMPIVSLVTDNDYFFGDKGIFSDNISWGTKPNYEYDWRRPVNLEYFDSEKSNASLNQLCETRLKGTTTRSYLIKSMVFYANKRFGTKRFDHEFFPEQRPGKTDFKSIEARNAGQDAYRLYMRDALMQRIMGENADLDWQAWQPALFYINGEYHGILNIRERANEDNIYTHYEGLEDIDIIEFSSKKILLSEGSMDNFNIFYDFYTQGSHTLEEYENFMDIDEFINYFCMQLFFANYDCISNNVIMWRPQAPDGKWRWIAKDLDFGLGTYYPTSWDFNYMNWLFNPDEFPADQNFANAEPCNILFKNLFMIPEFRDRFVERLAVYMGDFLTAEYTINLMKEMEAVIADEWPDHEQRNTPHWNSYEFFQNQAINWITNRYDCIYEQTAEWFGKGEPVKIDVYNNDETKPGLLIQGIPLNTGRFNGKYFTGETLHVATSPETDTSSKCWKVTVTNSLMQNEISFYFDDTLSFTIPSANKIEIEFADIPAGVENINPDASLDGEDAIYYDVNGIKISKDKLINGIYIRRYSSGKSEKIIIR